MHDDGVGSEAGERFSTHDGRHVHNCPGTLRPHDRDRLLGHVDHAEQTCIQSGVNILFEGIFGHRSDPADAGVVDEHINTAEALDGAGDERLNGRL